MAAKENFCNVLIINFLHMQVSGSDREQPCRFSLVVVTCGFLRDSDVQGWGSQLMVQTPLFPRDTTGHLIISPVLPSVGTHGLNDPIKRPGS